MHFHYVDQFQVIVSGDGISAGIQSVRSPFISPGAYHTDRLSRGQQRTFLFTFRASADDARIARGECADVQRPASANCREALAGLAWPVSGSRTRLMSGWRRRDGLSVQLLRIAPKQLAAAGFFGGIWGCPCSSPPERSSSMASAMAPGHVFMRDRMKPRPGAGVDGAEGPVFALSPTRANVLVRDCRRSDVHAPGWLPATLGTCARREFGPRRLRSTRRAIRLRRLRFRRSGSHGFLCLPDDAIIPRAPARVLRGGNSCILFRNPLPQRTDHVLHAQRVLPAIRQFGTVRPGDGVGWRAEVSQEGQHRVGTGALAPGADGVFPPSHEQLDQLMLREAERDLHLLATGDPAVNAQEWSRMRWIIA